MSISSLMSLVGATVFLGLAPALSAQDTASAPAVADSTSIAAGRQLYQSTGGCVPCHGEAGEGSPEGPSLVAGPWELGDGSWSWLLGITRHAGWGTRTREGDPRPMRGPTVLDSAGVRQVAAYVFSISRGKAPAPSR
jgi:mono/diheme cytochrome c family protein